MTLPLQDMHSASSKRVISGMQQAARPCGQTQQGQAR
jgi:hypothetical protein